MYTKNREKRKGFTLAEVLMALLVLGIVMILAIPTLHDQLRWYQYRTGVKKAKTMLDQALLRYAADYGTLVWCGYWVKNPYNFSAQCTGYDIRGNCKGWTQKGTNKPLPSDYNGRFSDCKEIYDFFLKDMNVIKKCDQNAYRNGCIPKYQGVDTLYKNQNEDSEDYDANKATAGISGLRQQNILNGKAFVTADGFIFMPYGSFSVPIMLVDVNGYRGPNKWGHDVHSFIARIPGVNANPSFRPYIQSKTYVEKGGKTTHELLYKKLDNSTM